MKHDVKSNKVISQHKYAAVFDTEKDCRDTVGEKIAKGLAFVIAISSIAMVGYGFVLLAKAAGV